ncbi:MAG: BON domain-containing protein [Gammaproteobacteria bacterium]
MKKLGIALLLALPLLSGCIPVVFVAGAAAGGAVIYDNRSAETILQDNSLAYKAQGQINSDPTLHQQTHIAVTAFNHIVLLVGQAPTADLRQQAYDLVTNLRNVKRIYNQITVETPTSISRRSEDTWITTKVKTKLLAEKGLHSSQIKVLTENGTVYLMGLVTRSQGSLAALVTSKVSGVQKVVTLFEYQS